MIVSKNEKTPSRNREGLIFLNKGALLASPSHIWAGLSTVAELAKTSDLPDLSNYATKDDLDNLDVSIAPKLYHTISIPVNIDQDIASYGISLYIDTIEDVDAIKSTLWYIELVANISGRFSSVTTWEQAIRMSLSFDYALSGSVKYLNVLAGTTDYINISYGGNASYTVSGSNQSRMLIEDSVLEDSMVYDLLSAFNVRLIADTSSKRFYAHATASGTATIKFYEAFRLR